SQRVMKESGYAPGHLLDSIKVPEGHERLVCGQRCSDLEPVLVTGTWASSSGLPVRSAQATTRSTAPLKGTPGRRHHRPSTQQNIG
ncbi:Uncharacterized protein DAT39_011124, partial [Clarias magur]